MYYPPAGFHFVVEFTGVNGIKREDVGFQEVSGIEAEIGVQELKEGGENRFAHRLPQAAQYKNLVLKRGMLTDSGLIQWFRDAVESFRFSPVTVKVSLLNEQSEPLCSWNFIKAYPVKWVVSPFDSSKNELVVETIELAYTYYTRL